MPTKQTLKVTKTKDKKRARIAIAFEFSVDDPQAAHIYRGIALCLREAFTPEEAMEFMQKFEAERAKLSSAPTTQSKPTERQSQNKE